MRKLLNKLPLSPQATDVWQGTRLPPAYEKIVSKAAPAWFVDAGNAQVLGAPHFSLQKMRVVALHEPDKRVEQHETFVLVTRNKRSWHVEYEAGESFGYDGELADAIGEARKRLEHAMAQKVLKHSELVVLDGESPPAGCLAVQKSVTVLTENGYPLSSVLSIDGPWLAKLGNAYAVKLHERSRHVFLVHGANKEQLSILSHYSRDSVFPGYPFPLVLADRLARVSNEEAKALAVRARAQLAKTKELRQAEAASDSHSILDSMG